MQAMSFRVCPFQLRICLVAWAAFQLWSPAFHRPLRIFLFPTTAAPPPPQPAPTSAPPVAVSVCINDCACVFGMTLELILQHFKLSAINCKNVLFFHLHSFFTLHIHTFHCIRSYLYVCVCVCMGFLCAFGCHFIFCSLASKCEHAHSSICTSPARLLYTHTSTHLHICMRMCYPFTHTPMGQPIYMQRFCCSPIVWTCCLFCHSFHSCHFFFAPIIRRVNGYIKLVARHILGRYITIMSVKLIDNAIRNWIF